MKRSEELVAGRLGAAKDVDSNAQMHYRTDHSSVLLRWYSPLAHGLAQDYQIQGHGIG